MSSKIVCHPPEGHGEAVGRHLQRHSLDRGLRFSQRKVGGACQVVVGDHDETVDSIEK